MQELDLVVKTVSFTYLLNDCRNEFCLLKMYFYPSKGNLAYLKH